MKFIDEAVVFVKSGKGGDGKVSFRREKYVARGGPDGGDGGDGGPVIFEATIRRNTLVDYHRKRFWHADDGVPGGKSQMHGANGEGLVMQVPLGTMLYDDDTGELLADLENEGDRHVIPGGAGGAGNIHFKSSSNRTPRIAKPGKEGDEITVRMELKLMADVGLLGFPNAGKSTFLSRVSAARPKVADYPFTTLVPQLGQVRIDDQRAFVVADIPGLIEGAAEGHGLGHQFLRHVERCGCYLHLVNADPWEDAPVKKVQALNDELRRYGAGLFRRPQVIVLNKIDSLSDEAREEAMAALQEATGSKVFPISSRTGEGIPELVVALWKVLEHHRAHPPVIDDVHHDADGSDEE